MEHLTKFKDGLLGIAGIAVAGMMTMAQAQCDEYTPCYENVEFGNAISRADCDRILQKC